MALVDTENVSCISILRSDMRPPYLVNPKHLPPAPTETHKRRMKMRGDGEVEAIQVYGCIKGSVSPSIRDCNILRAFFVIKRSKAKLAY